MLRRLITHVEAWAWDGGGTFQASGAAILAAITAAVESLPLMPTVQARAEEVPRFLVVFIWRGIEHADAVFLTRCRDLFVLSHAVAPDPVAGSS